MQKMELGDLVQGDLVQGDLILSLFTDMSNSSSSLSTEERHSNTPGSEQEGDEGRTRQPGMKKKEKNREAARKSRKKQTERADELHQELESLEGSNSILRKEIASLEREALFYTAALEQHDPFCLLHGPCSRTAAPLFVSCPASKQASASTPAATSSAAAASSCDLLSSGSSEISSHSSLISTPAPHCLFHCPGADPPCPPPHTPFPDSHQDPLVEILNDSKPSYSSHSDTVPKVLLSLLTIPDPLGGPPTSPGTTGRSLEQQPRLEEPSIDLSFLQLLEVNDWILQ